MVIVESMVVIDSNGRVREATILKLQVKRHSINDGDNYNDRGI